MGIFQLSIPYLCHLLTPGHGGIRKLCSAQPSPLHCSSPLQPASEFPWSLFLALA